MTKFERRVPKLPFTLHSRPRSRRKKVAKSKWDSIAFAVSLVSNLFLMVMLALPSFRIAGSKADLRELLEIDTSLEVPENLFESNEWLAEPESMLREPSSGQLRAAQDDSATDTSSETEIGEALAGLIDSSGDPGDMLGTGSIAEGIEGGGSRDSGTIDFIGIKAKGKRFLYVIDRSLSMFENDAWKFARDELLKSLRMLSPTMEFQVLFYNTEVELLKLSGRGLVKASTFNRGSAEKQIMALAPNGSTDHDKALKAALSMRPDVIFFLTDAVHYGNEKDQIAMIKELTLLNKRPGRRVGSATIHVLQFYHERKRKRQPVKTIKMLADANRGSYQFFDTNKLPKPK